MEREKRKMYIAVTDKTGKIRGLLTAKTEKAVINKAKKHGLPYGVVLNKPTERHYKDLNRSKIRGRPRGVEI